MYLFEYMRYYGKRCLPKLNCDGILNIVEKWIGVSKSVAA